MGYEEDLEKAKNKISKGYPLFDKKLVDSFARELVVQKNFITILCMNTIHSILQGMYSQKTPPKKNTVKQPIDNPVNSSSSDSDDNGCVTSLFGDDEDY